ncbi:MAG: GNAT family N-acetyltransferase [Pseudomonadota bacterium]
MKLEFNSTRLSFSPLSIDDLDMAIDLWTDPEIAKYVGGHRSEEHIREEHPLAMRRCAGGCIGIWTLTTKAENQKIGTAILLPMPVEEDDTNWDLVIGDDVPDGDIEIGYILKKEAWGKGYATEACKRLLRFAFEVSPLTELVASTDARNKASQNVLLKSGMLSLGLIRSYGENCPGFKITKEEWHALNA